MATVVVIINVLALALLLVIDTNPLRVSKALIHCNSRYKQLYLSNKIEHFSYKGGYGVRERMCIKDFKSRAGFGYR